MRNLFEECEVKTAKFSEITVGEPFVTFANRVAVVWLKTEEYVESEDEWVCPDVNCVSVFDGFTAAICGDTEVIRVKREN